LLGVTGRLGPMVADHGALSRRDLGDTLAGCPYCW
jgi:hypothetical protein